MNATWSKETLTTPHRNTFTGQTANLGDHTHHTLTLTTRNNQTHTLTFCDVDLETLDYLGWADSCGNAADATDPTVYVEAAATLIDSIRKGV